MISRFRPAVSTWFPHSSGDCLVASLRIRTYSASRSPLLSFGLCPGLLPKLWFVFVLSSREYGNAWRWLVGFDVSVEVAGGSPVGLYQNLPPIYKTFLPAAQSPGLFAGAFY